jgi:hypothetical protein
MKGAESFRELGNGLGYTGDLSQATEEIGSGSSSTTPIDSKTSYCGTSAVRTSTISCGSLVFEASPPAILVSSAAGLGTEGDGNSTRT